MTCCIKREDDLAITLDLGCFGHCEIIEFAGSPEDGTYFLSYESFDCENEIELGLVLEGESFKIDTSCFNENAEVCFKIYNSNNDVVEFENEGLEYQKFRFKTRIKKTKYINNEIQDECGKVI